MSNRTKNLFNRFGTINEQRFADPIRTIERVNRAGQKINEGYNKEENIPPDSDTEGIDEEEDPEDPLGEIKKVRGAGLSEGFSNSPTYAEHGPNSIRFAGLTVQGKSFIAIMPRIDIEEGIAWINRRIQGFKSNLKARESYEEAIRRKGIAAMGESFIKSMRLKGGDMINTELDMMLSPQSHSGIGDLDIISKKPDVVHISIDRNGDISGISHGIMTDEQGQIFLTPDIIGKEPT